MKRDGAREPALGMAIDMGVELRSRDVGVSERLASFAPQRRDVLAHREAPLVSMLSAACAACSTAADESLG